MSKYISFCLHLYQLFANGITNKLPSRHRPIQGIVRVALQPDVDGKHMCNFSRQRRRSKENIMAKAADPTLSKR